MKTKYLLKEILLALVLVFSVVSCTDKDELITELDVAREFAPVDVTARVRNQTFVELNWMQNENANSYIVEFSGDDPSFTNIFASLEVTNDDLPVTVQGEGETVYSIRIKVVSNRGKDESKWATIEATTLTEQIMLPEEPGDIKALSATLRWPANSNVTHLVLNPGEIVHEITAEEKAAGVATVTGLESETLYSAVLYNNTKVRGSAEFTTGIDVGDNTLVLPTDDLFQMIADAAPGDILLLEKGDYTAQNGTITLDKPITIQGLRRDFKPQLMVSFKIAAGATDVSLIDLDLTGITDVLKDAVYIDEAGDYNSLLISGCIVHDYQRTFVKGHRDGSLLQSLVIENSIVTNVLTDGGDFIDFRSGNVLNVTVRTSTFNNVAPSRDFIRLDDAGTYTDTGLVCNVLLENSTIYACSNSSSKRLMYVRFKTNKITVKNTLIAETNSEGYSDQSRTDPNPTFDNNNYWNAPGFFNSAQVVYDGSGTHTELDPGFTDAASGNFTVTNQTLIDNQVGDPRWLQ